MAHVIYDARLTGLSNEPGIFTGFPVATKLRARISGPPHAIRIDATLRDPERCVEEQAYDTR